MARGFVEAMGGELTVDDTPGGGLTMVVGPARGGGAMTRVLVVDDEPQILRALATNLRARGYDVDLAATGEDGLRLAAERHPDVVILDLGLPGIDGIEVVGRPAGLDERADHRAVGARRRGRQGGRPRRRRRRLRHQALRHGRAAGPPPGRRPAQRARRRGAGRRDRRLHASTWPPSRSRRDGEEVRLTPTEWHLVEVLVRHAGRLVSQQQLLQEVWGPQYGTESAYLRVHMAQVRRKLEPDPTRPRHFITERGMGYRFVT